MAVILTKTLIKTALYGIVAVFLYRLFIARRRILRLRNANLCMPEFSLLGGHFLALGKVLRQLPRDCTVHTAFLQFAKKFPNGLFYIDVWPYSKPLLIVTTPSGAQQLQASGLPKPDGIRSVLDDLLGGENLLTVEGEKWKRWRTMFNPGFGAGYMLGLVPVILEEVCVFRDLLEKRAREGKMFQVEELTLRMTLDIIGAVSMDTRLHYQTRDNALAKALRSQIEWTTFGTTFNPFKRYLTIRPIVRWYNDRLMDRYIESEIDKSYARTKATGEKPSKSVLALALQDYIQNSTSNTDTIHPAFKEALKANMRLFLFAGHDTTSSTLIFCYHHLSKHPSALAKMKSEHDQVFGKFESADQLRETILSRPQLLNSLPYTMAVIKETLRLNPPSSVIRKGKAGVYITDDEGTRYPTEGCNVFALNPALHRNPKYWPEPESFLPERWLASPGDSLHPTEGSWRPFNAGQRGCIGQTLAVLELKIALVMTVREFSVRPAYEEWDERVGRKGMKTVNGERCYSAEVGGGGAHPADGYPCRVDVLSREAWE